MVELRELTLLPGEKGYSQYLCGWIAMPRYWRRRIELDDYHRDANGFMRGDRPCTKIMVHFVFTPKYRVDISKYDGLTGAVGHFIETVCWNRKWPIVEYAVEKDHVHLLVQIPPTVAVSYVAQIIKGNVSKMVRELYPELKDDLNKNSFWGKRFFAVTVGNSDIEITKSYIENQGVNEYNPLSVGREPQRS